MDNELKVEQAKAEVLARYPDAWQGGTRELGRHVYDRRVFGCELLGTGWIDAAQRLWERGE